MRFRNLKIHLFSEIIFSCILSFGTQFLESLRSEDRSASKHYTGTLSCQICGLGFEANYEFMMNHFRAHRKNDDLRRRLLANFGPSVS